MINHGWHLCDGERSTSFLHFVKMCPNKTKWWDQDPSEYEVYVKLLERCQHCKRNKTKYNRKDLSEEEIIGKVVRGSAWKYVESIINLKNIFPENRRTAVDIGASFGFVSNLLSAHFDKVHSFEVSQDVRSCLQKNLKHTDNVVIHEAAGNVNTQTHYWYSDNFTGHSTTISRVNLLPSSPARWERKTTNMITLDSLEITDLDFLKIDVEGAEQSVLEGAVKTLTENSPIIYLELLDSAPLWNPKGSDDDKVIAPSDKVCFSILKELGYEKIGTDSMEPTNHIFRKPV